MQLVEEVVHTFTGMVSYDNMIAMGFDLNWRGDMLFNKRKRKRKSKPISMRRLLLQPVVICSVLFFVVLMALVTYQRAKVLLYGKAYYGEHLLNAYVEKNIDTKIEKDRLHSVYELCELAVAMNNKIDGKEVSLEVGSAEKTQEFLDEIQPFFAFTTVHTYVESGGSKSSSTVYQMNYWMAKNCSSVDEVGRDIEYFVGSENTNTDEYSVTDINSQQVGADDESPQKTKDLAVLFRITTSPETLVKLYKMCHVGTKEYAQMDEIMIYGTYYDSSISVSKVQLLKDRNPETGDATLIGEVQFDESSYIGETIIGVVCKKEDLTQYYTDEPLTASDVLKGNQLFYDTITPVYSFDAGGLNFSYPTGGAAVIEPSSIWKSTVRCSYPISDPIEARNEAGKIESHTQELLCITVSFSPILLAMRELVVWYIIGFLVILLCDFIMMERLRDELVRILDLIPRQMKKKVERYHMESEIIEVIALEDQLNQLEKKEEA